MFCVPQISLLYCCCLERQGRCMVCVCVFVCLLTTDPIILISAVHCRTHRIWATLFAILCLYAFGFDFVFSLSLSLSLSFTPQQTLLAYLLANYLKFWKMNGFMKKVGRVKGVFWLTPKHRRTWCQPIERIWQFMLHQFRKIRNNFLSFNQQSQCKE